MRSGLAQQPQSARRRACFALAWVLTPFTGCGLSNEKHRCATDGDCLAGRVCNSGVCSSDSGHPTQGTSGMGGTDKTPPSSDGGAAGSSVTAEPGGTSGNAGGSSGRGEGNAPQRSDGGNAGQSVDQNGMAGGTETTTPPPVACDPMLENVTLECSSMFYDALPIVDARAASVSGLTQSMGGFQVFAVKAYSDMVATAYNRVPDGPFTNFICFDGLPAPARLASTAVLEGTAEVFAVARCGTLWERHLQFGGWVAWKSLILPAEDARVSDVAATRVAETTNFVYVTDRGNAYVRHRVEATSFSDFGAWSLAAKGAGSVIAAGGRSDGRQQMFTLDEHGRPLTSVQVSPDVDAAFDRFTDFGDASVPPFIDIEAADGLAELEVFGLDIAGGIWTREEDGSGSFTPWAPSVVPPPPATFRTLAGAGIYGLSGALALVGASESGAFVNLRIDGSWRGWTLTE
jgi:hypothetical protein